MKRFLIALFIFIVAFSLSSCVGGSSKSSASTAKIDQSTSVGVVNSFLGALSQKDYNMAAQCCNMFGEGGDGESQISRESVKRMLDQIAADLKSKNIEVNTFKILQREDLSRGYCYTIELNGTKLYTLSTFNMEGIWIVSNY